MVEGRMAVRRKGGCVGHGCAAKLRGDGHQRGFGGGSLAFGHVTRNTGDGATLKQCQQMGQVGARKDGAARYGQEGISRRDESGTEIM